MGQIMVNKTTYVNGECKRYAAFGERIVLERDRLKLKQGDICVTTGVSRTTQSKYETGDRAPDVEYLSQIASRGFDVVYIATGCRSSGLLTDEHQNLIEAYEAAPEDLKRAAFAVLLSPWRRGLLDKPMKEPGYFQAQILGEESARYEQFRLQEKPPIPYLDADGDQEPKT